MTDMPIDTLDWDALRQAAHNADELVHGIAPYICYHFFDGKISGVAETDAPFLERLKTEGWRSVKWWLLRQTVVANRLNTPLSAVLCNAVQTYAVRSLDIFADSHLWQPPVSAEPWQGVALIAVAFQIKHRDLDEYDAAAVSKHIVAMASDILEEELTLVTRNAWACAMKSATAKDQRSMLSVDSIRRLGAG